MVTLTAITLPCVSDALSDHTVLHETTTIRMHHLVRTWHQHVRRREARSKILGLLQKISTIIELIIKLQRRGQTRGDVRRYQLAQK